MSELFLSESDTARAWLHQFVDPDIKYAKLLLDSLTLISEERLVRDLQALIYGELDKLEKPVAIVPIREMEPKQSYYKPVNNKDAKPNLLGKNSFPGSEAIIANIATRISRLHKQDYRFLATPSLRKLREYRCRSILFFDDFVGSGTRVNSFYNSFYMNKTIKSWISYKFIKLHLFTYSITEDGSETIKDSQKFDSINYVLKCPTFEETDWTFSQKEKIEKICKRYMPKSLWGSALGYKGTSGLMVFEHSAPNNLPAILWRPTKDLNPLFPNRAVPLELAEFFNLPPVENRLEASLKKLGQLRLADGKWALQATPLIKKVILVLGALSKKTKSLARISDYTCLPITEIKKIVIHCRDWGLVDKTNRLTLEGYKELEFTRKMKLHDRKITVTNPELYFPSMLRGVKRC